MNGDVKDYIYSSSTPCRGVQLLCLEHGVTVRGGGAKEAGYGWVLGDEAV